METLEELEGSLSRSSYNTRILLTTTICRTAPYAAGPRKSQSLQLLSKSFLALTLVLKSLLKLEMRKLY